ncbi:MAG TPA: CRISPR-associated helicase Cas3' [Aldersonia sp.]
MDRLALPSPWRPGPPPPVDALFADRFALPDGAKPRPVQVAAYDIAVQVAQPGLMIIEAGMGEGKTEAALAAAEVLAHRTGAGGCLIALPTMATSDAMFGRVLRWAQRLPRSEDDGPLSIFLAHSKSRLNDDFVGLMGGRVSGVGIDEDRAGDCAGHHDVLAHQWLFGRKKGVLADIVVVTIDQVLFAALKSRHLVLRHLALANKVVILDELHALDTYMNVYMDRVVEWLGSYRIPTIILSATLPSDRRVHLIQAYESVGREHANTAASPPRRRRRATTPATPRYDVLAGDIGYPVITATTGDVPLVRAVEPSDRCIPVTVEQSSDDDDTLVAMLRRDLRDGGCAAVIRNTVGRAQRTKQLLDQHFPGEVVLAHSRFLAGDRSVIEADLRRDLGPTSARGAGRPARRIVVGTQVLEQSLDVDFDVMVTDLAPIDLLLQRAGRLHRHKRPLTDRPAALRVPRLVVTGVEDWNAAPVKAVPGSRFVYGDITLFRAVAVLLAHLAATPVVTLPRDVAPLVQSAYAPALTPPAGWENDWAAAEREDTVRRTDQRTRARNFLLDPPPRRAGTSSIIGWIDRGAGEADDSGRGRAQVRDTEDGIEVIAVQRVDAHLRALPWLDRYGGDPLDTGIGIPPALARALATCTVRLPPRLTRPWVIDRVIDDLEPNGLASWQSSPWLAGELILVLDADLTAGVAGFRLGYDRELGLLLHADTEGNAR